MYPYRLRTSDPEVIKSILGAKKKKRVPVKKPTAIKLGHCLRPIRKDVFIGRDNFNRNSLFSFNDLLVVESNKKQKYYDFIFKKRF